MVSQYGGGYSAFCIILSVLTQFSERFASNIVGYRAVADTSS